MSLVHARTIIGNMTFNRLSHAQGDEITITCWTGKVLFKGPYSDPMVDTVLDANRCPSKQCSDDCQWCDGTGYSGEFEINWANENDKRNVYEFINY